MSDETKTQAGPTVANDKQRPLSADEIRAIERTNRTALEAEVIRSAGPARRWVLGGPTTWTKDELVKAVCRIRRGEDHEDHLAVRPDA